MTVIFGHEVRSKIKGYSPLGYGDLMVTNILSRHGREIVTSWEVTSLMVTNSPYGVGGRSARASAARKQEGLDHRGQWCHDAAHENL